MQFLNKEYGIIETIATGGMATIYRGMQISLSREVVIKKLHPHLAQDANFVIRFKREAAILAKLQHKNIVRIIDFFELNNEQYIILEYINGKTLKQIINEKQKIPFKDSLYIINEVLHGLKYIHDNNVLHRDLKPDNIMISVDGEVKITDFGLALKEENLSITNPGTYLGTPAYFPPEQLMGKHLSTASDIFSLGILFAEILTGKNPFEGKNQFETINNILYHTSVNIGFHGQKAPQKIVNLLYSMLEKDPAKRIQKCDEIISTIGFEKQSYNNRMFLNFLRDIKTDVVDYEFEVSITKRTDVYKFYIFMILVFVFFAIVIYQVVQYTGRERMFETVYVREPFRELHTLFIDSKPQVKDFIINDSIIVRTPQVIDLYGGFYKIALIDTNYEYVDTMINLDGSDTIRFNLVKKEIIERFGYVDINIYPWAELYIDNVYYDKTPFNDPVKIKTGKRELLFVHPNRKPYAEVLDIMADSVYNINKELDKVYGYFKIVVRPWADVYINDSLIGTTPLSDSIKLLTGPHMLKLKNPKYNDIEENILIKEKEVLLKIYSF